jgi:hypothetical protein
MSVEKLKYLRVATPEQWDYWLTLKADAAWSYFMDDWHVKELEKVKEKYGTDCLFCKTFEVESFDNNHKKSECKACMPKAGINGGCLMICPEDRIDMAIERLEKAGLWD